MIKKDGSVPFKEFSARRAAEAQRPEFEEHRIRSGGVAPRLTIYYASENYHSNGNPTRKRVAESHTLFPRLRVGLP